MKDYKIYKVTEKDGKATHVGCRHARDVFYGTNDEHVLNTVKIELVEERLTEQQVIDHTSIGMSYIPRAYYREGRLE